MRTLLIALIWLGSLLDVGSAQGRQLQATDSLPGSAAAKDPDVAWAYIGFKGGAHFSDVFFSDTFRPVVMRTSLVYNSHFGFVGKLFLSRYAGIQAEAIYVKKGYEQLFQSGFYSASMSYLEIPFMANAYFGKKRNELFINAGPYFEVFLSQEQHRLGVINEGEEFYPFDPDHDRTLGYGFRASAGINRRFVFGLVQLEGGMAFSISDMLVSNRLVSQVPDGSKHYTGFVSLSYMIPIGKKPMP